MVGYQSPARKDRQEEEASHGGWDRQHQQDVHNTIRIHTHVHMPAGCGRLLTIDFCLRQIHDEQHIGVTCDGVWGMLRCTIPFTSDEGGAMRVREE